MRLRLPAQSRLSVRLPEPDAGESRKFSRLAQAINEMNENFEVQRREVRAFQQAMQTLGEGISVTASQLRAYSENLDRIDVARLGRKSRHLAKLMTAYEANA